MPSCAIRVAVRVRPLNVEKGEKNIVQVDGNSILIANSKYGPMMPSSSDVSMLSPVKVSHERRRKFSFDLCFGSNNGHPKNKDSNTQEGIFLAVGKDLVNSVFNGFNW